MTRAEAVRSALRSGPLTSQQIARELGWGIHLTRKTLRCMIDTHEVHRYAHWYGKLSHTFKYRLNKPKRCEHFYARPKPTAAMACVHCGRLKGAK